MLRIKSTVLDEATGLDDDAGPGAAGGDSHRTSDFALRAVSWADLSDGDDDSPEASAGWWPSDDLAGQTRGAKKAERKRPSESSESTATAGSDAPRASLSSTAALFDCTPKVEEKPHVAADVARTPLRSAAAPWTKAPGGVFTQKHNEPLEQSPATNVERTTLMMRNVPCSVTRAGVLRLLDSMGFVGQYNFFYLPVDFKTGLCFGYAFVNLTSEEQALRFASTFDGFCDWPKRSAKVCSIIWPEMQGLAANIDRYQNSPVMSDQVPDSYKPVLFVDKKRVAFPKPTKVLRGILHRS